MTLIINSQRINQVFFFFGGKEWSLVNLSTYYNCLFLFFGGASRPFWEGVIMSEPPDKRGFWGFPQHSGKYVGFYQTNKNILPTKTMLN